MEALPHAQPVGSAAGGHHDTITVWVVVAPSKSSVRVLPLSNFGQRGNQHRRPGVSGMGMDRHGLHSFQGDRKDPRSGGFHDCILHSRPVKEGLPGHVVLVDMEEGEHVTGRQSDFVRFVGCFFVNDIEHQHPVQDDVEVVNERNGVALSEGC